MLPYVLINCILYTDFMDSRKTSDHGVEANGGPLKQLTKTINCCSLHCLQNWMLRRWSPKCCVSPPSGYYFRGIQVSHVGINLSATAMGVLVTWALSVQKCHMNVDVCVNGWMWLILVQRPEMYHKSCPFTFVLSLTFKDKLVPKSHTLYKQEEHRGTFNSQTARDNIYNYIEMNTCQYAGG